MLTKSFAESREAIVARKQIFETAVVASRLAKVVVPANEQNLDRLTVEVARS